MLWSSNAQTYTFELPRAAFIAAFERDGEQMVLGTTTRAMISVGIEPVYVERRPIPAGASPAVATVNPPEGDNALVTTIAIQGSNFQQPVSVRLEQVEEGFSYPSDKSYPLENIVVDSAGTLQADVPIGLPGGTYDLVVINDGGWTATLPQAYTVLSIDPDGIGITPTHGRVDRVNRVTVSGDGFSDGATVTLLPNDATVAGATASISRETTLSNTVRINSQLLRSIIEPLTLVQENAVSASGAYTLTVINPSGSQGQASINYLVYNNTDNDLFAERNGIWTDPAVVRDGSTATLGVIVERQGGQPSNDPVTVDFYLNEPDNPATLIGSDSVVVDNAPGTASTAGSDWLVPQSGTYDLFVVIRPEESDQESLNGRTELTDANNVISRTITVRPAVADQMAPSIRQVTINDGSTTVSSPDISINLKVTDTRPGTGLASLFVVEYEYSEGAGQWVAIQQSGWLSLADRTFARIYRPAMALARTGWRSLYSGVGCRCRRQCL
ncbi:MAG: hypothetical protein HC837_10705 [Chloroflexaceae bacterium]|nr:hypothetical protein [Chloroflexaceae bacterium]